MKRLSACVLTTVLLSAAIGCGGEIDEVGYDEPLYYFGDGEDELYAMSPPAVLGVDASRSGIIDFDDPDDLDHRYEPAAGYGALFLPNLDDDGGICAEKSTDEEFEMCFDAMRAEVVNDADLADMARIETMPTGAVASSTYGILDVDDGAREWVRLYKKRGDGDGPDEFVPYEPGVDEVHAQVLEEGAEFAIEGLALPTDPDWDGTVELRWTIEIPDLERSVDDRAHMELAPVLFRHHMDPASVVYAVDLEERNADFVADLETATEAAGVDGGLELLDLWDPWIQDFLLTAYMAIPGPDGPHSMHLYFRSANMNYPASLEEVYERIYQLEGEPKRPQLREAGQVVYTDFHGSGVAGRAEYDPDMGFEPVDTEELDLDDVVAYLYGMGSQEEYPEIDELEEKVWDADTLNSYGNTEVVPPHVAPGGEAYPHGRVFRGRGDADHMRPDPTLSNLIDDQGAQPLIWIDTAWLLVAHVDETISFVESDTERGWSMLYNDPVRAREILERLRDEEDAGDAVLFEDRYYRSWSSSGAQPAATTVEEVLDDEDVMAASARAAVEVDAQVDVLQQEVGIEEHEMVPIAFLHEDAGRGSVAYQPGIVNGISLTPDIFGAPDPHGPVIDGEDVFQADVEDLLQPLGVDLHWIETWDVYHLGAGQVHCGSNVRRQLPQMPWWTKEDVQ